MSSLFLTLFLLNRVFYLSLHERIRILFKDAQASTRAEIDSLAAIVSTGIICRVLEYASTGGFEFRQWGGSSLRQISVFLVIGLVTSIPGAKREHRYRHTDQPSQKDQC